jgi:type I restriction enzyme S subunit
MMPWPTRPLGDVCQFIRGVSFKPTDLVEAGSPDSLPCFRTKNVQIALNENDLIHIPQRLVKSDSQIIREGDILISTANSNDLVGKCCFVPRLDYTATLGGFIADVRARLPHLNARFLYYWLSSPLTQERLRGLARQTTNISNLPLTDMAKELAPVPPLSDQERLIKLLDEVDELRKLRAQADRHTADLFPALFHDMFGRHIKSPPVVVSLEGGTAPQGWKWSRLTDVARLATGHTPSRRVPHYWNGNIPWISLTDIRALDGTVAQATSQSVTEKGIENSSAVKLPNGTVCFSRTASVGFVTMMGREMCTSQDFVNWVCGDELEPIYLMGALMQAREYLRSLASGSTHQTIYFPTVEQFCVLVPPLPLQKNFAKRATEIRELQAQQAGSRERLDALFQSMLHRAFRGEL